MLTPERFRDRLFELAEREDNSYKVAATALNEITDPADWEAVARLTAPSYISNLLRRTPPPTPPGKPRGGDSGKPRTFTDADGNKRASSREVDLVDWWARRVAVKVLTAAGEKTLGACTVGDLDWIAQRRRAKAAEDIAAAERYEKLAAAMRETGKTTVAEIDPDTGRAILET